MFRKPTIAVLEARELDDMRRALLIAEQQRDYYIHTINYCNARIAALEARSSVPEMRSTFWGHEETLA